MLNKWVKPKADRDEFQMEYFIAFGKALGYQELVSKLSSAEERMRTLLIKVETENVKQQAIGR